MINQNQVNNTIQEVNKELFRVIEDRWSEFQTIKELVEKQGADVNATDDTGSTVLHEAIKNYDKYPFRGEALIKYLVNKGANVNAKDGTGSTPLHKFAQYADNNSYYTKERLVQLLIDNGADLEEKDPDGWTPLQQAIKLGNDKIAEYLLKQGADHNTKDHKGSTPLHKAVNFKYSSLISTLIAKADVDAKDNENSTPIHAWVTGEFRDHSILYYLKDHGAQIDTQDNEGFTPLMRAVEMDCSEDVIERLKSYGASSKITNNKGENALDIALKHRHAAYITVPELLRWRDIEISTIGSKNTEALSKLIECNGSSLIVPAIKIENLAKIRNAYETQHDQLLKEIKIQEITLWAEDALYGALQMDKKLYYNKKEFWEECKHNMDYYVSQGLQGQEVIKWRPSSFYDTGNPSDPEGFFDPALVVALSAVSKINALHNPPEDVSNVVNKEIDIPNTGEDIDQTSAIES